MGSSFPLSRVDVDRPAVLVGDEVHPPVAYVAYLPRPECYREVAACGIHLYCFTAYLAGRGINSRSGIGPFRSSIWQGPGHYDFADVVTDVDMILAADPAARLIVRLYLDVPEWWEQQHPEGCCQRPDGSVFRQCFHSPLWFQEVSEALRAVIRWFRASPYAPHLAGIQVAAGMTEEWFYHFPPERFVDRNPARAEAFHQWLARHYGSAAARALPGAADEKAALAALEQAPERRWRDATRERAVLDACRFHGEAIAEAIATFCRVVKEESAGRLLTGAFYGYHFYVPDVRMGHTALSRLLACPDLDFVASPNQYDRSPGTDWPPMAAVDSVRLHGKLWMAENDTRTALTRPLAERAPAICPEGQYRGGVWEGPKSLAVSAALLRTNVARMLTHGYGGWWFDMWGGWFSHPDLLAELAAAQDLWQEGLEPAAVREVPPEALCVILDERLAEYDASFGALTRPLFENHYALAKCGRPYRVYLRDDLQALNLAGVRFLWMLGMETLTPAEDGLLQGLAHDGCAVLHTGFAATRRLPGRDGLAGGPWGAKLTPRELRAIIDGAGLHSYLETDDVLYVGRGFVAIHAAEAGEKVLRLPRRGRLTQVLPERQELGVSDRFRVPMAQFETRLFRIA